VSNRYLKRLQVAALVRLMPRQQSPNSLAVVSRGNRRIEINTCVQTEAEFLQQDSRRLTAVSVAEQNSPAENADDEV